MDFIDGPAVCQNQAASTSLNLSSEKFHVAVLSPGVNPRGELPLRIKENGAEIIGELELAYRVGKGNYVSITGTNGKTTTTTLVGEIFKAAGKTTYVVGNIGDPVVTASLKAENKDWLITETSSFQLETVSQFKPKIAAILNLTQDHLDRHITMEGYGLAKAKSFQAQDSQDYRVLNYDDERVWGLRNLPGGEVVPFSRKVALDFGAYLEEDSIVVKDREGKVHFICEKDQVGIPGAHNLENALAAAAISFFAGISPKVIGETLISFKGVEHRLELVREINGVRFVNDSKGTNPDASIKAIEATKGGLILIAGGSEKGSTFEEFLEAFRPKGKALLLMGKTGPGIFKTAENMGMENAMLLKDMEECIYKGYSLAAPGDTVLLSPACASFDMYSNYEERGRHFKLLVEKLWNDCQRKE